MADTNEDSIFDPSARPIYTQAQLHTYLDRICFPTTIRILLMTTPTSSKNSMIILSTLIKHHLCNIPFENLDLHYSSNKNICLDHDHIFEKILGSDSRRGGWCFENNLLFATVLRTLRYDVLTTGARVNEAVQPMSDEKGWKGPRYSGW